jgi:hypothetical protein
MAACPAPAVACISGQELQNLNIWNCDCEPLVEPTGIALFDELQVTLDDSFFRGDVGEKFTVR